MAAIVLSMLLTACAEREIDIMGHSGKVVGNCIAGYDWHFYGLQDSIDYMLYECARKLIEAGYSISDMSLLNRDFSLPSPPDGQAWNKKLAMKRFHAGAISEQKLGYILAAIEYEYHKVVWRAGEQLADGEITRAEFVETERKARRVWQGR